MTLFDRRLDGLKPAARSREADRRRAELTDADAEIANLTEAIAAGKPWHHYSLTSPRNDGT